MPDTPKPEEPQEPPPSIEDGDKLQRQFDLYKLRAEEYERSFFSARDMEWRVAFQTYAGYALVISGFAAAYDPARPSMAGLAFACIVAIGLIFGISLFWHWQIAKRTGYSRDMQNANLDCLHKLFAIDKVPHPAGKQSPSGQRWWAVIPFQVFNIAIACALIWYIVTSLDRCGSDVKAPIGASAQSATVCGAAAMRMFCPSIAIPGTDCRRCQQISTY